MTRRFLLAVALCAVWLAPIRAADISGKWTASFDTQIGKQTYTFDFKVVGATLTGRAKSDNGDTEIKEGKVTGDTVTFVENLNFQGMELKITYTGKIVSDDEIKFTRDVAGIANEELTAKRAK
jgi:opacity protein-like surface antigen